MKLRTKMWQRQAALLLAVSLLAAPGLARQEAAAVGVSTARAAALSGAEREAVGRVKLETIREVTAALSAKEMEGRGTGQPGADRAAQYIADRFARLGLKPLGEKNSYLQPIKFREFQLAPETSFRADDVPLKLGEDYYVAPPHSGDEDVSGRLVFVAYGLQANTPKRDDLKGMDVRGKIVVLVAGPPKGVSKADWDKANASLLIMRGLVMAGAAGLVITNSGTEKMPYATMADYLTRRQVELADAQQMPAELPPFVAVSDAGAEKLFEGSGTTYKEALARAEAGEFVSRDLKRSAKIKVKFKSAKVTSSNVVGLLEGSDPKLKEEAVVYTAHYDAWGLAADGRVYHGAADNALGVGEMVAIAEAMAAAPQRPRRSVIFLAVTGEEHGLYGAEHWAKNPTWKIKQVAANLNFDGTGTEIHGPLKKIVGFGMEHSDLGEMLTAVSAAMGVSIIPDPMPEEKTFYRSDHYAFVKKGVPALMLLGAADVSKERLVESMKEYDRTHYHQPTDTITPAWDWQGPLGLAQLGLVLGMRVADAEAMPSWLKSSPLNRPRGTNEPPPPMN